MSEVKRPKTIHDVRGKKIKCINFISCPLCYGCRNYNSAYEDCNKCLSQDKKKNICNTELHRSDLISQMVSKTTIKFSNGNVLENLEFKNYSNSRGDRSKRSFK